MVSVAEQIYHRHHQERRRESFAIFETERGKLFKALIGTGKKILDLGCRDGIITKYFAEGNDVIGADIDAGALEKAKSALNIKTVHFDLNQTIWPLENNYFDVVVAAEIIEHLFFPNVVLGRISKFIKPGGMIIGSVPNAFSIKCRLKYALADKRGTPLQDPMHINQFSWREFKNLLKNNFSQVNLFPLGKKYYGLAGVFPGLLVHSIAFSARKDKN
ncbi:MAG: hypothetical protein A2606_02675 [Candidatus Yanofskybacteria bacterium RIFOXYD1_FULL_42_10]|uniref:Methyltransferase type 11 domain-containing protein n=1 Tax=Candidatus Yanofskybacteria bacterium RIFOXYD1_FULL_42_10 TaxID=1802718 RepID=A0A1F8HXE1_9BACT|nr:MAG: hypothetical protein A2606_02675 [Candidatus Yanofskybacteria bacterium RIFOXYD1_FULL_42_10]